MFHSDQGLLLWSLDPQFPADKIIDYPLEKEEGNSFSNNKSSKRFLPAAEIESSGFEFAGYLCQEY